MRRLLAGCVAACVALLAPVAARADPLFAAAGDIACAPGSTTDATSCRQSQTAALISAASPDAVATLGDNQYDSGLYAEFTGAGAFDATWGQFKALIHPALGNHEYDASSTADGYFTYFGAAAGEPAKGYYSYDLGAWHIIALNSGCSDAVCENSIAGEVTTAETQWLHSDLASHAGRCTLAYWHHPRFSSGNHGDNPGVAPLWSALYAAHADIVLNGHDHDYERLAQQDPAGAATTAGIREFVVGTGGSEHYGFPAGFEPNSEYHNNTDFGALFLTLHPGRYDWQFRREDGAVLDTGSTSCHYLPPAAVTHPASAISADSATLNAIVNPNGQATSYRFEWGPSATYGAAVPVGDAAAGGDTAPHQVSQQLTRLAPATTYHVRVTASNAAGTSHGTDLTFTTAQAPAPDNPAPPTNNTPNPAPPRCSAGRRPDAKCTPGAVHRVGVERVCKARHSNHNLQIAPDRRAYIYREYGVTAHAAGAYAIDHLIPTSLGGTNTGRNLWPEPTVPPGYREKDRLERNLLRQVCRHRIKLSRAQRLLTRNWIAAYRRYH